MVTFIFKFNQRLRLNSEIQDLSISMPVSSSFASGFQKSHLFSHTMKNVKIAFQTEMSSALPVFIFSHCTSKTKDIASKFCPLTVVYMIITYIPVTLLKS